MLIIKKLLHGIFCSFKIFWLLLKIPVEWRRIRSHITWNNFIGWVFKYGLADLGARFIAVIFQIKGVLGMVAFAASLIETFSFYIILFFTEFAINSSKKKRGSEWEGLFSKVFSEITKRTLIPLLLDTIILRPFYIWIWMNLMSNKSLGLLLGMLTADVIFYVFLISMEEFLKEEQG